MHWGTFKLTDEPLGEPPARIAPLLRGARPRSRTPLDPRHRRDAPALTLRPTDVPILELHVVCTNARRSRGGRSTLILAGGGRRRSPARARERLRASAGHAGNARRGVGHCPQMTPAPRAPGLGVRLRPCSPQQRSCSQWILVTAAGHEQQASIDVASAQSSARRQYSTPGDGPNRQQKPAPRTVGPRPHSTAAHAIAAQLQTGHSQGRAATSMPSGHGSAMHAAVGPLPPEPPGSVCRDTARAGPPVVPGVPPARAPGRLS